MRNLGRINREPAQSDIDVQVGANETHCQVVFQVGGVVQSVTLENDAWDKIADLIKDKIAAAKRGIDTRIIAPGQGS